MIKKKLYKLFVKEFLKNFFFILVSLSLLMLLTQASKFLSIITELGNSTTVYIKYILLNYPRMIEKIFLLSFLISIFFTVSKLKNDKELEIFWLSGISQKSIFFLLMKVTTILFLFYYLLTIFIGPYTANLARKVLAVSEFTLVNSLVKEKNFNTPLKELTIYVDTNDKKGNLRKIFIYENERIISAKYAKVIKKNSKIYLELENGNSQEKNDSSINLVSFDKLVFDLSKFQNKNVKSPKFSERKLVWLINNIYTNPVRSEDIRYELNKRLIKPLLVFLLLIFSTYILYSSEDDNKKINYNSKIFIFSFLLLVLNEILLNFSSKNIFYSFLYFFIIFVSCLITYQKHRVKNLKK